MQIIGQDKLVNQIDKMVGDSTLPQFIVLQGDTGCGKTTMANYIVSKLNAYIYSVNNGKLDDMRNMIKDTTTLSHDKVYLIENSDKLNLQCQNAILKLVEEPPKHAYIILETKNINNLLTTIQSRARILTFEAYLNSDLRRFTDNELLLSIYTTPGQILRTDPIKVQELHDFCKSVLNNIKKVSILNLFNIPTYINVNKKTDGFELNDFLNMFSYLVCNNIKQGKYVNTMVDLLKEVNKAQSMSNVTGVNKLALLDITLLNIRKILEEM